MVIREEKIGNLKEILNKWYTTTEQYNIDKEELERRIASAMAEAGAVHANLDNLNAKINSLIGFTVSLVEELPKVGEYGVIYLMKTKKSGKNYYEEYLWHEGKYYQIGEIDLSDYATNARLDSTKQELQQTATGSRNGMMSNSDKSKLDGIQDHANNYSLPTASSGTKGGVKVGSNLFMSDETLNAKDTTYGTASGSSDGLMSRSDKSKLDGIQGGANNYSLPAASSDTRGGIKVGSGLSISGDVLSVSGGGGSSGGGSSYVLPTASPDVKGGIKVGSGLAMDGETLNCTVSGGGGGSSYNLPTASPDVKGGIKVGSGLKMDGEILKVDIGGGDGWEGGSNDGFNINYYQNIAIISWWETSLSVTGQGQWVKYKELPCTNAGHTVWTTNLVNASSGTLYFRVQNNSSELQYRTTNTNGRVPITAGQLVIRGKGLYAASGWQNNDTM